MENANLFRGSGPETSERVAPAAAPSFAAPSRAPPAASPRRAAQFKTCAGP